MGKTREVEVLDDREVRKRLLRGEYTPLRDLGPTPVRASVVAELRVQLARGKEKKK